MPNHAELETQLVNELHELPLDALETILKLTLLLKKNQGLGTAQTKNFVDFIRNSPLMGADLDVSRDPSACRNLDL